MIRKILGILLILLGLILKISLAHNIYYWEISKNISIISFIFGLIILTPFNLIDSSYRESKNTKASKMILRSMLNLTVIAVLFAVGLGLGRIGDFLNYKTRDLFLSRNTETTNGVISGIKRIDAVKVGHADFYIISFKANGEKYASGLLVDYAKKDGKYLDKFRVPNISEDNMTIATLKGSQAKIVYSKKFPSFFRIIE